jgi:uncharacterized C2H2 Zn-finger protein
MEYICSKCSKVYKKEGNLKKHLESCGIETKCAKCGNVVPGNFKKHVEICGIDAFKCDKCDKAYKTEKGLQNHKCKVSVTPTNVSGFAKPEDEKKEFPCTSCEKVYKTEKGLQNHKCKASGDSPTNVSVNTPTNDSVNVLTENGKKEFPCTKCKKVYKTEKGFSNHKCLNK